MTDLSLNKDIVSDVRRVAEKLGVSVLSRSEYLQYGNYSAYHLYDGGATWEDYCTAAGLSTKRIIPIEDEVYFANLVHAVEVLGRLPKTSERKTFGLNFSKRRYPTFTNFIETAQKLGIIETSVTKVVETAKTNQSDFSQIDTQTNDKHPEPPDVTLRSVPPIPAKTRRTKWERTGVEGFPYAPRDESGTVALFGILCAQGIIKWQIVDLTNGKGIDAICWDDESGREIKVELKHTLSRASWNHSVDDLDYVVCWENRWSDFPKPVVCLRNLLHANPE